MKQVKRRQFLKNTTAVASAVCGLQFLNLKPVFAQATNAQKRVFVVFLRGGFDGLMLLPPANNADFQQLASLRSTHLEARLDSSGLPLKDSSGNVIMDNVYSAKNYAPLAGAPFRVLQKYGWPSLLAADAAIFPHTGSLNTTRSHFEQQDFIEGGSAQRILRMGYLSRLTDVLETSGGQTVHNISVGPNVPDSMRGGADPLLVNNLQSLQDLLRTGNATNGFARTGAVGLKQRLRFLSSREDLSDCKDNAIACKKAHAANESLELANQTTFDTSSTDPFSIAADVSLSQLKPRLITIDVGGWDIHDDAAERMLPEGGLLSNLATGLTTLKNKLIAANQWNNSVIVVMSEFGRTLSSNGNQGVDHGRGGTMMVFGGQIKQPTSAQITKAWDFSRTDGIESSTALQVLNDYRLVLANIFTSHLSLPGSEVIKTHATLSDLTTSTGVFPVIGSELTYRNLGFFKV